MIKRIISSIVLLIVSFGMMLIMEISAASFDTSIKVYDYANLLEDSEEKTLSTMANEISERLQLDTVIVTIRDSEGKSSMEYADDFFDYNGFGYGNDYTGILLLVNMQEREVWISTTGKAIRYFNDNDIDKTIDVIYGDLKNGEYFNSAYKFLKTVDSHVNEYINWEKVKDLPLHLRYSRIQILAVCLIIGLTVSAIVLGVMLGLHRLSFSPAPNASVYLTDKEVSLFRSEDRFMSTHTSRRSRNSSSSGGGSRGGGSTHTSSSGRSHGGGGRKF